MGYRETQQQMILFHGRESKERFRENALSRIIVNLMKNDECKTSNRVMVPLVLIDQFCRLQTQERHGSIPYVTSLLGCFLFFTENNFEIPQMQLIEMGAPTTEAGVYDLRYPFALIWSYWLAFIETHDISRRTKLELEDKIERMKKTAAEIHYDNLKGPITFAEQKREPSLDLIGTVCF